MASAALQNQVDELTRKITEKDKELRQIKQKDDRTRTFLTVRDKIIKDQITDIEKLKNERSKGETSFDPFGSSSTTGQAKKGPSQAEEDLKTAQDDIKQLGVENARLQAQLAKAKQDATPNINQADQLSICNEELRNTRADNKTKLEALRQELQDLKVELVEQERLLGLEQEVIDQTSHREAAEARIKELEGELTDSRASAQRSAARVKLISDVVKATQEKLTASRDHNAQLIGLQDEVIASMTDVVTATKNEFLASQQGNAKLSRYHHEQRAELEAENQKLQDDIVRLQDVIRGLQDDYLKLQEETDAGLTLKQMALTTAIRAGMLPADTELVDPAQALPSQKIALLKANERARKAEEALSDCNGSRATAKAALVKADKKIKDLQMQLIISQDDAEKANAAYEGEIRGAKRGREDDTESWEAEFGPPSKRNKLSSEQDDEETPSTRESISSSIAAPDRNNPIQQYNVVVSKVTLRHRVLLAETKILTEASDEIAPLILKDLFRVYGTPVYKTTKAKALQHMNEASTLLDIQEVVLDHIVRLVPDIFPDELTVIETCLVWRDQAYSREEEQHRQGWLKYLVSILKGETKWKDQPFYMPQGFNRSSTFAHVNDESDDEMSDTPGAQDLAIHGSAEYIAGAQYLDAAANAEAYRSVRDAESGVEEATGSEKDTNDHDSSPEEYVSEEDEIDEISDAVRFEDADEEESEIEQPLLPKKRAAKPLSKKYSVEILVPAAEKDKKPKKAPKKTMPNRRVTRSQGKK